MRDGLMTLLPATGALDRERLRWVLRADRAALYRTEGCRNTAEYLSAVFHISNWKARRWIDAAWALEHLPLTAAALENGSLSLDKVVELVRFATPATEKKLVNWARRVTVAGIRSRGDAETKKSLAETDTAQRDRHLSWSMDAERLSFEGQLPAAEGHAFVNAIDDLARSLPSEPDVDDAPVIPDLGINSSRTIDQRRADALVLLVSNGGVGDKGKPTLVLHADAAILAGEHGGCRVTRGPVLHAETARRLSCDARLRVVLEGADGNAVGIGRTSQITPHWLRDQVFDRDGYTCTFPGCEMKSFLTPHHIQHWIRGGATDADNLVTVCTTHHRLVHEGRWSVMLDHRSQPLWFRPGGRVHDPGPAPPELAEAPVPEPPRVSALAGMTNLFDYCLASAEPSPAARRRRRRRLQERARERRPADWFEAAEQQPVWN